MKFMAFSRSLQLYHLFLRLQGIRVAFLKAITTKAESVSIQRFSHLLWLAISIALSTPDISAWYADPPPMFSAKQQSKIALEFLNIPPQEEFVVFEAPSVLHFTQLAMGGCQITSLMTGALGGCMLILNFFKMTRSLTEELEAFEVLFLDRATLEIMLLIANLQCVLLDWNLA